MIKYYKLYDILKRRDLKTKDLIKTPENPTGILSPATMAKLSKGDYVNTQTIDKLCVYFGIQPGDLMEYEPEKKSE